MFRGSLPADIQRIVRQHVGDWQSNDVYIGCSGNLTLERVLGDTGRRLHGNDILLYSSAIGSYLAGNLTSFDVSATGLVEFPWIGMRFESPEEKLATLLIMSRLSISTGKSNAYWDRLKLGHRNQWDTLVDKTVQRIETCDVHLASFAAEDVQTWIDRVPASGGVISYPPFYAGDYENQFKKLESLFTWHDQPEWVELNNERVEKLFEKIADRENWMLGVNRPIEALERSLKGVAQTTNRGIPVYVYGSSGKPRLVQPRQPLQPVLIPHLQKKQALGDEMKLIPLKEAQFSALRSMYMNHHIKPGSASLPVGVTVDGVLVGVFAYSFSPTLANWDTYIDGPHVYLLSDFPVANTSYKHLAKLVLYAALSKEAKAFAERSGNKRYISLTTTAFAKNPVSMKYRGLMKLLKRKENEAPSTEINSSESYYAQPYELQYGSEMGRWSLSEGLTLWKKKHGDYQS